MKATFKSKVLSLFKSRGFLVVNACVLFLLILSFGREFVRGYQIDSEIKILQAKAAELESRKSLLEQLSGQFGSEEFIEKEARLKLGMKKPGERVFIVERARDGSVAQGDSGGAILEDQQEDARIMSNPRKWLAYFLH